MLLRLLRRMNRSCFQPVVVSLVRGGSLEAEIGALGIPLYHAGMQQGRLSVSGFARIVSVLRKEKPDLVQGWMVHGNLAAQAASLLVSPQPRLYWAIHHSLDSFRREKPLTASLIRLSSFLSRYPEKIVYVSHVSREQHERIGFRPGHGVVIPNGINPDLFVPREAHRTSLREELGLPADALLIGLIGRFHPQKNHAGFLEAMKKVVALHPEARVIFAGSEMEADNEEVLVLVRASGLDKAVFLLGERRDMERINAALDIAVSASSFGEAHSLAIGEAMACAVPCVVTNVGDNGLLVGDTGIVVAPNDTEGLTRGCLSLIRLGSAGRQALGARARERITGHFSLSKAVSNYENLYSTSLSGKEGNGLCVA